MPRFIIKCAPDADLYMEWSTIVESPTWIGKREELEAYLLQSAARDGSEDEVVRERITRADTFGTSALYPRPNATADGGWDDDGQIVEQQWWLPRSKFYDFAAALLDADIDGVAVAAEVVRLDRLEDMES